MGFFNETVEAYLDSRSLAGTILVFMDFVDAPRRWWPGYGDLSAGGQTWQGTGELIAVDGLEQPMGTAAPQTTFTLSGVDRDIVALARSASDRVKGRRCVVSVQFFEREPSVATDPAWKPLDQPVVVWSGRMDQMRYTAQGPASRSVTVTAESLWVNRSRPPYGLYSPADQGARYPGDRGLDQMTDLVTKTIRWPVV